MDLDRILQSIHEYFEELGMAEIRKIIKCKRGLMKLLRVHGLGIVVAVVSQPGYAPPGIGRAKAANAVLQLAERGPTRTGRSAGAGACGSGQEARLRLGQLGGRAGEAPPHFCTALSGEGRRYAGPRPWRAITVAMADKHELITKGSTLRHRSRLYSGQAACIASSDGA